MTNQLFYSYVFFWGGGHDEPTALRCGVRSPKVLRVSFCLHSSAAVVEVLYYTTPVGSAACHHLSSIDF